MGAGSRWRECGWGRWGQEAGGGRAGGGIVVQKEARWGWEGTQRVYAVERGGAGVCEGLRGQGQGQNQVARRGQSPCMPRTRHT